MLAQSDKDVILALKNFLFSCVPRVLHQVLNGRKSVAIVVKVKNQKFLDRRVSPLRFLGFYVLIINNLYWVNPPLKKHLVFVRGFTSLYHLIFNWLYPQNHIGETPCSKSFSKKYIDHGKH